MNTNNEAEVYQQTTIPYWVNLFGAVGDRPAISERPIRPVELGVVTMGRTNATSRDVLNRLEDDWQPFRNGLRRQYKADFDRLFTKGRQFADATGYANLTDPELAFVLSVVLAQEHELRDHQERVAQWRAIAMSKRDDIMPGHAVSPEMARLQSELERWIGNDIEWVALIDVADRLDLDEATVEEAFGQLERHPELDIERDASTGVTGWHIDTPE